MLDQQVVRAALKSRQTFTVQEAGNGGGPLPPFSAYLRLLQSNVKPPLTETWNDWRNIIQLLEWRAARLVDQRARLQQTSVIDAMTVYSDQRVSKAVTEAFVAAQVGTMITSLPLKGKDRDIFMSLFTLVR